MWFSLGLAWSIIPNDIGITSTAFTYNSWRIFLLICAAPSFIVAGLLLLLPESPKYLLSCGRYEEALDIFRGIYAINTGKPRDSYTVNMTFSIRSRVDQQNFQNFEISEGLNPPPIPYYFGSCKNIN